MADLHTRLRDPGPSWRRGRRGWCRRSRPTREPSPGGPRRSPTRGSAQRAAGQLTQAGPSPPVRPRPAAGRGSLRVGATAVAVRQALKGEAGQEGQADRLATSSNRTAVAGRRCLQRRRARPFLGRARRGRSERGGPSVGSGSVVPRWRSSVSDGPVVAELLDRGGDQSEPGKEPALAQRLGREQGRPVRRQRAARHAAHRPRSAAHPGTRRPATLTPRVTCRGPGPGRGGDRPGSARRRRPGPRPRDVPPPLAADAQVPLHWPLVGSAAASRSAIARSAR